ncbi:hypothetical protein GALMADRAFT_212311 [Galerina marginata CBS 339.88]|uniref:SAP domain-containing protein n=1 Tax=Galerina marginata (strain CBS 339.88) TaxID=685588 RepID=A0A067STC8_GALM3|nr:hypothetical protein GALMADRAFT_212311 [Galerina marginata CBS 339.88]
MPPIAYSGALQPKKKSELQEIAIALRLSDQGTKDELQARIKRHLDAHQDALEDEPMFAGLFGRRKRSVQPQHIPNPPPSSRFAPSEPTIEKPRSSTGRRITALDPIREATPVKDLRDVSTFLKHPFSPLESTPNTSPRHGEPITPSSLPPLPPSPSPAKSIVQHLPNTAEVRAAVQVKQQEVLQNGFELLIALRAFLSNSRNIWSLTSVFELLYILANIIPWQSAQVPISPRGDTGPTVSLTYPPSSIFTTYTFWAVILHWAIPTLIVPTLVGCIISFNPSNAPSKAKLLAHAHHIKDTTSAVAPLDPLTASIIRLAAQTAYPYAAIGTRTNVVGLDVLGSNWRVLSASVGLAFSFAEAISGAPQVVAEALIRDQSKPRIEFNLDHDEREATPTRRALMAREEEEELVEVD